MAIGRRRLARQRGPGDSGAHDPARRQPGGHRRAAARHPTPRRLGEGRADPGRGDGQEQGRRIVNGADAAAQGAAGARRASAIVVAVLCLLWVARTADAVGSGGRGQVLFVAAMFVLPLAYVVPATRAWWTARRWWLLAAQAVLTCVPFAVFGSSWVAGVSGLLAGLVLLTVAACRGWCSAPSPRLRSRSGLAWLACPLTPAHRALSGFWSQTLMTLYCCSGWPGWRTWSPR